MNGISDPGGASSALLGGFGRLGETSGHLIDRRILPLNDGSNRRRVRRALAYYVIDLADRLHGSFGSLLDGCDLSGNFISGMRRLAGERFDFGGDHRKSSAQLSRARGFDGCIERQEISLAGQ